MALNEIKWWIQDKWDDLKDKRLTAYIGILFGAAAIAAALLGSYNAVAAELTFAKGESLKHNLSVCLKKEDAIAIVQADMTGGFDAAAALWQANDQCQKVPIVGPVVGNVIFAGAVSRNGATVILRVVEIVVNGKVEAYFLTSATVNLAGLKKDRDA